MDTSKMMWSKNQIEDLALDKLNVSVYKDDTDTVEFDCDVQVNNSLVTSNLEVTGETTFDDYAFDYNGNEIVGQEEIDCSIYSAASTGIALTETMLSDGWYLVHIDDNQDEAEVNVSGVLHLYDGVGIFTSCISVNGGVILVKCNIDDDSSMTQFKFYLANGTAISLSSTQWNIEITKIK